MQTRKLGYSDLYLTTVGLGTWAIGGEWAFGWGPQDDAESIAAIQHAIDRGVNWLDTAAVYGLGYSEKVIGQAIAGRRDEILIATKCGLVWDEGSTEPYGRLKTDSVRREVEASLHRLNVDVIDLYQIHWPNPDEEIEEAWRIIGEQSAWVLEMLNIHKNNIEITASQVGQFLHYYFNMTCVAPKE